MSQNLLHMRRRAASGTWIGNWIRPLGLARYRLDPSGLLRFDLRGLLSPFGLIRFNLVSSTS